jgi:hypothetical protein
MADGVSRSHRCKTIIDALDERAICSGKRNEILCAASTEDENAPRIGQIEV